MWRSIVAVVLLLPVAESVAAETNAVLQAVVRCAGYTVRSAGRRAVRIRVYRPFGDAAGIDPANDEALPIDRVVGKRRSRGTDRIMSPTDAHRWYRYYRWFLRAQQAAQSRNSLATLIRGESGDKGSASSRWGWLSRDARPGARRHLDLSVLDGDRYPWLARPPGVEDTSERANPLLEGVWVTPMGPGYATEADDSSTGLWKPGKR